MRTEHSSRGHACAFNHVLLTARGEQEVAVSFCCVHSASDPCCYRTAIGKLYRHCVCL